MNKDFAIGIFAPSLPSDESRSKRIQDAIKYLEALGCNLRLGKSTYSLYGYKSAPKEDRLSDLHAFIEDPEVKLVLSTTGGFNSNELLEFINWELLKANPTFLVGYSDLTALTLSILRKTNIPSISGPLLVDFQDDNTVFKRLFDLFESRKLELKNPENIWEWDQNSKRKSGTLSFLPNKITSSSGKAIAANLSTLVLLFGTPYTPDLNECVLFIEYDKEEANGLASIERMLWQLRQAGYFKALSGLVFGLLEENVKSEENQFNSLNKILSEVTEGYSFPVIYNAQFGHVYPSWFIVNGSRVEIADRKINMYIDDNFTSFI